ncbi:MAG: ABC transporter ATP-binding protein [Clostridia bacterium]
MSALLEVKNLKVSFFTPAGEVKAVNDITYSLEKGKVLGIVGESGSGKSVSSFALMGLIDPPGRIVGGSITFDGNLLTLPEDQKPTRKALRTSEEAQRSMRGNDMAMIFQDPMTSLNPVIQVGKQIAETIRLHNSQLSKEEIYQRSLELLTLVGIPGPKKRLKQYPFEFSGGMRQRVMIAIALANNPKLLIADEPTTALDVTIQAQILELIKELKDKIGMSVILITHDLGIVADIADDVAVMYGGKIVETGSSEEVFHHAKHPYTLGLMDSLCNLDDACTRLTPIEGQPIDLLNIPAGCMFAERCNFCMKICINEIPPTVVDGTHQTACWLLDERRPATI